MNSRPPKLCRARPCLPAGSTVLRKDKRPKHVMKRRHEAGEGVRYMRCGGGYRVLRRYQLPGDDRNH